MAQLKVERGAVARYFESLGEVLTNATKLSSSAANATDVEVIPQSAVVGDVSAAAEATDNEDESVTG